MTYREQVRERFMNLAPEYGEWRIDRNLAAAFIDTILSESRAQVLKEAEEAIKKTKKNLHGRSLSFGVQEVCYDLCISIIIALQQSEESHEHQGTEYIVPSDGKMWCAVCGKSFKPSKS